MKISKITWVAIAFGAVVIGGISLLTALNQQTAQKEDLKQRLAEAKQKLAQVDNEKLIEQRDALNAQIEDYKAQTEKTEALLSYPDDNIKITESVILNAVECQVELLDVRSPGPGTENLAGVRYATMSMVVRVRGTTATIADFVCSLKEVFPTCVIKSLSLEFDNNEQYLAPLSDDAAETDNRSAWLSTSNQSGLPGVTGNVSFVIYNYQENQ